LPGNAALLFEFLGNFCNRIVQEKKSHIEGPKLKNIG